MTPSDAPPRAAPAAAGGGHAASAGERTAPRRSTRVLHVITALDLGGTETMLVQLLGAMDPSRVESTVVTLRAGGALRGAIEAHGAAVHAVGMGRAPRPADLARLRRIARGARPDVVQGWLVHGNVAALAAGRAARVPVLWGVRAGLADLANEPLATRVVLRASVPLARGAARIVYNSTRSAAEHEALGYPQRRRLVVPNGFDLQRFRPDPDARREVRAELGVAPDAPVVGLLARWHAQKDHATFLRAAARLRAALPDAVFLLAGTDVTPANPALRALVDTLRLGDAVRLLGARADAPRLMAALDLAALTSRTEALPNVVGEAMAAGVPCVCTDAGDVRALVGDTGRVVPVGDDAALADAWLALLAEAPAVRQTRAEAARARIVAHFSLPAIAERYATLWERAGAWA